MSNQVTTLVIGLGGTGQELVRRLSEHLSVVAVEIDAERAAQVEAAIGPRETLRVAVGDATSALVLRRLGLGSVRAAVACTDSDETNLEALRVAGEVYGVGRRLALLHEASARAAYEALGVDVAPRGVACATLLEKRLDLGQREATGVGLGRGEIREVTVMPRSPLAGRTLAEIHPRRWLLAAVYRDEQLVVPHGDTRLEVGDRVLLVGEPHLVPAVAELFLTGVPEFPLQYGTHVVVLRGQELPKVVDEAAWLVEASHADKLEAIACDLPEPELERLSKRCAEMGLAHEFTCVAGSTEESLANEARRRDVGVLVVAPEPLGWLARLGLVRPRVMRLLDRVDSPMLLARGSHPYRRVLLPLVDPSFDPGAAQLAFDLAGTLEAELTLAVVHQPPLVVGPEFRERVVQRQREVESMASLWQAPMAVVEREGNPVHEVVALAADADLVILSQLRRRRPRPTRPDVVTHLIHALTCSVMVLPHDGATDGP